MNEQSNSKREDEAYRQFFEAVIEGGIENIVRVASELFESPVLVTDENYRLICQFPKKAIGNPVWDLLYETKTLPKEVIWTYQNYFLNNQTEMYQPFYADWGMVEDAPRIFGEVYDDKKIYGHIAIFLLDKPPQKDDIKIAQIFIDALKIEITRKRKEISGWHTSVSTCLLDLLNQKASLQVKQRAIEILEKKVIGNYTMIVTPMGAKASEKAFSTYVVTELPKLYRNVVAVIHDNCIVTLIGEVNLAIPPETSDFIKHVIEFLAEHNFISGICDGFENLREIPLRYRQAYLTARIAFEKQDFPLGVYKNYAPLQMFYDISHHDVPEVYTHPQLEKISQYDKANNTEYYETLRVFSLSLHNKERSAHKLAVHRNTLLYRLNRIKDIFDLPVDDEKTALYLVCSFLLRETNRSR
jgi:hypothetical protein